MAAIRPAILIDLKKLLESRYVLHLPPLLGSAPEDNHNDKQVSRAFSAFVIQSKFDVDAITAAKCVVDDYNDQGIDAVYYHDHDKTLYIVQSKLKRTEQFQLADAQSFTRGIRLLIDKNYEEFNQNVRNIGHLIENGLDQCEAIQLIVAYTGDGISPQAEVALTQFIQNERDNGDDQLKQDIVNFDGTAVEYALHKEHSAKPVKARISIQKFQQVDQPKKTVFGVVKVDDLVALHNTHNKALYEKNIRYFIGVGSRGVNSAIKQTLEEAPEEFLYLNNGITAVCNHIEQKSRLGHSGRNYDFLSFSVVNGAQTIASAAQFKVQNPAADTSAALVMITIIQTYENNDFHKQVTKARNLQNPVDLSHFAALDDTQERLRKDMKIHGVDYHYRPQQATATGVEVIKIDELSKSLACLVRNIIYPGRLKNEAGIFVNADSDSYMAIFSDDLMGAKAINAVRVFREIQTLLANAETASLNPESLIYRHCLYPLASVLMKLMKNQIEGEAILTAAQIRPLISVPFDELRQKFSDIYPSVSLGYMPHAFFKHIGNTAILIIRVMIAYQNMARDVTVSRLQGRVDANDPHNQALADYLTGKATQI